ncbi:MULTISPECIES: adenosine deaminase [Prauserella salsuginis group]|uniref:adenosine deaminase n=2 Tax=Prauserella salsuginis group TaxID=2893672 RepID=A0A839Y0B4_9PSEU|nr:MULTISPECIES: adenosine deaminase [Prauserella salsuginis group]MBB3666093.1 adenosine deaminase [Prauserella sediminis]MCR3718158.1 adenosine deaminase [Prauserella flava]MCR3732728.1 adenosine deaminase [Prauserella salsuginis]
MSIPLPESGPLIDLHRHLEGSIRPSTAHRLAARAGARASRSEFVAGREGDLLPYLAKIDNAAKFATMTDDWWWITHEAVADACDDGLTAVEFRFSPQFIAAQTGLEADAVIEVVTDAAAGHGLPIDVGLIGIVVRDEGPDSAGRQMRRLLRHADRLVGVDLAGDEAGYPVAQFSPAFGLAHDAGVPVTIHAGEAAGPGSVWNAVRELRPMRIGHGVRSAEDPRLLDHLAAHGITLEVAITSNVQTGAAENRRHHQLGTLVAAGVPVALCTDNPSVSNTRLSREFDIARELVGAEAAERIRRHGFTARFGRRTRR